MTLWKEGAKEIIKALVPMNDESTNEHTDCVEHKPFTF